jgi:hypothetical protein
LIDNIFANKILKESYCDNRRIYAADLFEGIENLREEGIFLEIIPRKFTYLVQSTGRVTNIRVEDEDIDIAIMACALLVKGMKFFEVQELIYKREELRKANVQEGR